MVKRNQYAGKKARNNPAGGGRLALVREVPVYELKPKVEYGKLFIVMEDADKNTFFYNGSAWVPYKMTMAQCRAECLVKELPQKVNGKVRYEVREPIVG
jgi:hypothetical protein